MEKTRLEEREVVVRRCVTEGGVYLRTSLITLPPTLIFAYSKLDFRVGQGNTRKPSFGFFNF